MRTCHNCQCSERVGVKPAAESFISLNSNVNREELLELRTNLQNLAKGVYTLEYLETLPDSELDLVMKTLLKIRQDEMKALGARLM